MSTVKKGDNLFHDDLDFTNASMEMLYNIVDRLDFTNGNEAEAVYQGLKNTVSNISFSDYLKRYIYQKAGLEGSWREISDNVYASILLNSWIPTSVVLNIRIINKPQKYIHACIMISFLYPF